MVTAAEEVYVIEVNPNCYLEQSGEFSRAAAESGIEHGALVARMQSVAVECFNALRLRDYARVDLRVSAAEEVYVIEVNPNCYLEQSGEFSRAAAESGMAHEALIARIVELAQGRYTR